ncbi:uncharacterized protein LOC131333025 [Rhododendron vialii]|uniref:uncharacterized protein LOC131333025 n=1 Tax=Rhododendron vialii TaxID=182163 RepID=UPI00265E18C8|nr:uncharacterized protein LOC131333025 [Rhododendron vialii]
MHFRTLADSFSLLLSSSLSLSEAIVQASERTISWPPSFSSFPSSGASQKPSSTPSSPPPSPATAASSSRPTKPSAMIKVYGEETTIAAAVPLLSLLGFLLSLGFSSRNSSRRWRTKCFRIGVFLRRRKAIQ